MGRKAGPPTANSPVGGLPLFVPLALSRQGKPVSTLLRSLRAPPSSVRMRACKRRSWIAATVLGKKTAAAAALASLASLAVGDACVASYGLMILTVRRVA